MTSHASRRGAPGRRRLPRRLPLRLAQLLCLALLVPAPGGAAAEEPGRSAGDPPRRVATLLPFVADALEEVATPARVVATVRRELRQPVPEGVADLGNPHAPSLEVLVAARPDLVVGDVALHAGVAGSLGRGGADVMLLDTRSVDSTLGGLAELGARLGAREAMQAAVTRVRERLAELRLDEPRSALVLFGAPGSFFAMSERTWLGDLAARLGLENVVGDEDGSERHPGLVPLADERLARLRPQVVLLVTHGDPAALREAFARRLQSGPWRSVRETAAVTRVLDPRTFAANPGLRLPEAAEALLRAAGGDASARVDAGGAEAAAR